MARYKRTKGGNKTEKTGIPYIREELEKVYDLYIKLGGKGIHERNPQIHELAGELKRDVRSVENQLLGFKIVDTGKVGRANYNKLIKTIWNEKELDTNSPKEIDNKKEDFDEFKFRISSQLKNILGRNLITDDFVAVFELVKNSFDAHAKKVKIIFEKDKIIIWDDGKGMNRRDIIDKWLFIAYSAKHEGTEDIEFIEDKNKSFRDRINPNRSYAGEKGIGRLGCDRLGSKLSMTTRKINDSIYWNLNFDWDKYEVNALNEFSEIEIDYKDSKSTSYSGFNNGLILEISNLRNIWPRKKIINLKRSLSKLINPFSMQNDFSIEIIDESEIKKDNEIKKSSDFDQTKIVNGEVKNFVFEALNIATTQIKVSISKDETSIETQLVDRGDLIYNILEPNPFKYIPSESSIQLFYLNKRAKGNFTRLMGMTAADFGSIFLFNNGFRVLPYGEPNNDPFDINQRKAQGYARFLGTRELIGQVSIAQKSEYFKETTSRDGGLEDSPGVNELNSFFMETLKKLESFVSPILWKIKRRTGDDDETLDSEAKEQVLNFVEKISGSKDIKLIDYSNNLIDYINENIEEENLPLFDKLRAIAIKAGDKRSLSIIDKDEKKYQNEVKKRKAAEKAAAEAEEKAAAAEEKAASAEEEKKKIQSENLFLKSVRSTEFDEVVSFLHHIGLGSKNIDSELRLYLKKLRKGSAIDKKLLLNSLDYILLENRKILTISKFASKANFKLFTSTIEIDLIEYIVEYINNILGLVGSQSPRIEIQYNRESKFVKEVKPIELNIIIDNLISNSRRAKASNIKIYLKVKNDLLIIRFLDDGNGIDPKNHKRIFELGFTTTSGSGIGLYHLQNILNEIGGTIAFNQDNTDYTEFIITLKR